MILNKPIAVLIFFLYFIFQKLYLIVILTLGHKFMNKNKNKTKHILVIE